MYQFWVQLICNLCFFALALYCLEALQLEKIFQVKKPFKVQVLYIMMACALSYLTTSFFMSLIDWGRF